LTDSDIRCSNCSKLIKVKIFSAGFMDVIAFSCDRDSTVLTISTYDKTLNSLLGKYPNSAWTDKQFRTVEEKLMICSCGGKFKHDAKPKCPNCGAVLPFEKPNSSEFVVVGRWVDGERQDPWRA